MNKSINEFSKLLNYLDEENTTKPKEVKKQTKKEKRAETKKKIEIQDYQSLAADIPSVILPVDDDINGFNVNRFKERLRRKLVEDYVRSSNYERPYLTVSEITGCIRKTYYKRLKYNVDLTKMYTWPYLYLILKVGDTIHSIVQEFYDFDESEKTIKSEKYKVKGRIDAVKGNILFELKTLDPTKFTGTYQEMHYRQGLIYTYIMNHDYGYNIHGISIVYIMRTLKDIKPFNIKYDEGEAQKLMDNASYLNQCIESKNVPEPLGKIDADCKWCEYKKYCDNDIKVIKEKDDNESVFLL